MGLHIPNGARLSVSLAITAHPDFNRRFFPLGRHRRGSSPRLLHTLTTPNRFIQSRSSPTVLSCGLILTYGDDLFNSMLVTKCYLADFIIS